MASDSMLEGPKEADMPCTVEDAVSEDVICQPRRLLTEYEFEVGDLGVTVTIRLWQHVGGPGVWFTQSHFIHTPDQAGPYCTSQPWGDDEGTALHAAVRTITNYYDMAVHAGHTPAPSWLVPNRHFRGR
jgi:hypothetical protein